MTDMATFNAEALLDREVYRLDGLDDLQLPIELDYQGG